MLVSQTGEIVGAVGSVVELGAGMQNALASDIIIIYHRVHVQTNKCSLLASQPRIGRHTTDVPIEPRSLLAERV